MLGQYTPFAVLLESIKVVSIKWQNRHYNDPNHRRNAIPAAFRKAATSGKNPPTSSGNTHNKDDSMKISTVAVSRFDLAGSASKRFEWFHFYVWQIHSPNRSKNNFHRDKEHEPGWNSNHHILRVGNRDSRCTLIKRHGGHRRRGWLASSQYRLPPWQKMRSGYWSFSIPFFNPRTAMISS